MPSQDARRIADILAGTARIAFGRIRSLNPMDIKPSDTRAVIEDELRYVLSTLRILDEAATSRLPPEILTPTIDAALDQIALLALTSSANAPQVGPRLDPVAPYLSVLADENGARRFLGMAPNPGLSATGAAAAGVGAVEALAEAVARRLQTGHAGWGPPPEPDAPLFSEATAAYVADLRRAKGEDCDEAGYIMGKSDAFIRIVGDKRIDQVTREDLQTFVDEIVWLNPDAARRRDFEPARISDYIAANKAEKGKALTAKTVRVTYLGRIKSILKDGCERAHVEYRMAKARIRVPKVARHSVKRRAPDLGAVNTVIKAGVATGILSDALLTPLGLLTGRRIGLLAFLRREDIVRYNGVWIVIPKDHVVEDGVELDVPYKTGESLGFFVLHDIFEQCGFVAWAKRADGAVFQWLMQAKDPADAAQKRMTRLYKSVADDTRMLGSFHWLRHGQIAEARELKIDPRAIRLQVGHEAVDVHDDYGGDFTRSQLREIAGSTLPPDIDWSILSTIDWEAYFQKRPKGGRPRRST